MPRPGRKKPDGTIGNRGGRSVAETKAFLDSLSAPPSPPKPVEFLEPAPAAQLAAAVDEHRRLTDRHTAVLQGIHDHL